MTRFRRSAAALSFLLAAAWLAAPADAQGKSRVDLPGLRGGQLTAADLGRGNTILVVWASWSPRCRDIVDRVNDLSSRWGAKARVATVDFQEESAAIEEFLRGKNLAVPVYLDRDGEFSKANSVTALPAILVYQSGEVKLRGRLDAETDKALSDLLGD
jgi:thiol-disulfide isomerase/thioredoxin